MHFPGGIHVLYFLMYDPLFLLLGRPGVGYIMNTGYTWLYSHVPRLQEDIFGKFLLLNITSKNNVTSVIHSATWKIPSGG